MLRYVWLSIAVAHCITTALPAIDQNGYVVFCPCMGRFGNQVETYLGTLNFARQLNRTLILPPFLAYPTDSREAKPIPFDELFNVNALASFHRVITMESFMNEMARKVWPPKIRKVLCWSPHQSIYDNDKAGGCQAKEGNPFGPFWDYANVDFIADEYYGELGYDVYMPGVVDRWKIEFSSPHYPVLAFSSAPASFPLDARNRNIQQHLQWNERITNQANAYANLHLHRPIVGIHLRNGADWAIACNHVENDQHFFASAMCTGDDFEFGRPSKALCMPSRKRIIEDLKVHVRRLKARSVFVSADDDHMIAELSEAFNGKLEIRKMPRNDPHVSLAILDLADHLIANCMSTYSAFAVRQRQYASSSAEPERLLSYSFFGYDPPQNVTTIIDEPDNSKRQNIENQKPDDTSSRDEL